MVMGSRYVGNELLLEGEKVSFKGRYCNKLTLEKAIWGETHD